jgi:Rps23 Pro-64 3,4-dihydroxylase Tpa1-like proline 4-hydroxylase
VFDPATFEKRINSIRTYRNEPDAVLLRLGHPILRRAVHEVLGRVHDEATHRWTLGRSELPPGVEGVLIFHVELQAQNELRENLHHEILSIPFQWAGNRLAALDDQEWEPYATRNVEPLSRERAASLHQRLNQVWTRLEPTLLQVLKHTEAKYLGLLTERAKTWKAELAKEGKTQFEARLKEIGDNLSEKGIKRLEEKILADQKDLIAVRQQSQSLFEELEMERQEQLLNLENDLVAREQRVAFLEQRKAELMALQDQLKQGQDRWLNKILPKRYAIPPGGLSVLPLAFEVRVRG